MKRQSIKIVLGAGVCALVVGSVVSAAPFERYFQNGLDGYEGSLDIQINQGSAYYQDASAGPGGGPLQEVMVDGDTPPTSGLETQVLLRFDEIIGPGAGQIPMGAQIESALLVLRVTNPTATGIDIYRLTDAYGFPGFEGWQRWVEYDDDLAHPYDDPNNNDGITPGEEAMLSSEMSVDSVDTGFVLFDVTASLEAWVEQGQTNMGWALLAKGEDGMVFDSTDNATQGSRPLLAVTYIPEPASLTLLGASGLLLARRRSR